MENNSENKARFFAMYLNQHIVKWHKRNSHKPAYLHFTLLDEDKINSKYLELKPLSSISDEDLDFIIDIIGERRNKNLISISIRNTMAYVLGRMFPSIEISRHIQAIDYLRSKGYALPWMGLSVEKQIEYGWVVLN